MPGSNIRAMLSDNNDDVTHCRATTLIRGLREKAFQEVHDQRANATGRHVGCAGWVARTPPVWRAAVGAQLRSPLGLVRRQEGLLSYRPHTQHA